MDVRVGLERKLSAEELMLLNCGVGEDSWWESLGLQGDPPSPSWRRPVLGVDWKDWCWGWNSNTSATSCEELTHWKRPWCWEGLRAGGDGDDWGWDGWMASPTQWTWVWVNSGSWWWTGRPGMLRFMGSQRVGHDWVTELNWTGREVENFLWRFQSIIECLYVCPETDLNHSFKEHVSSQQWNSPIAKFHFIQFPSNFLFSLLNVSRQAAQQISEYSLHQKWQRKRETVIQKELEEK